MGVGIFTASKSVKLIWLELKNFALTVELWTQHDLKVERVMCRSNSCLWCHGCSLWVMSLDAQGSQVIRELQNSAAGKAKSTLNLLQILSCCSECVTS